MRHQTRLASGAASAPRWSHSDQPERARLRFVGPISRRALAPVFDTQTGASALRLISDRRGVSLVVVMIAISMSMALTYAALSSQARGVQVRQNVNRREMARQAAESGVSITLNKLQSSTWSGVTTALSGTLSSDKLGTTSYTIEFRTIDGQTSPTAYPAGQGQTSLSGSTAFFNSTSNGLSSSSADTAAIATRQAFQLLIRSTGKWASLTDPLDFVTEIVEVGIELQPRVPGRQILAPDITQATDVLASNAGYDTIQNYAFFASDGSSTSPSLTLQPGQRFDGPTWLKQGVSVYKGPMWSSSIRDVFLQSTGTLYSTSSSGTVSFLHPHPFGGPITMAASFTAAEVADLTKLNVPRVTATSTPTTPAINFDGWKTYQLYQGGFSYSAEAISSSSLNNVVLRPSLRNPLGVFYRDSALQLDDNVIIQGTLVCFGKLTLSGSNLNIASVNWRDSSGGAVVANGSLFPRLPAVVAQSIQLNNDNRASVDGAVLLTSTVSKTDGNYELLSGTELNLSGTQATSVPIRQPYSQVQLPATTDLSSVSETGTHAIWLADGNSGNWFAIIDVDTVNRRLIVLGEASRPNPVSYRIRRKRLRSFDVRGPLMATRSLIAVSGSWKLSSGLWSNQYSLWQLITQIQANNGQPITPFVTWVADPLNYNGWGSPWESFGLPLEPVTHIRPQSGIKFRDSLPLFKGYIPPSNLITATNDPSGYRWRVLFWRELP